MTLAAEGLPAAGAAGYELLDQLSGFGTTAQMFDAAYWRAKEGELARTILSIPEVRAALTNRQRAFRQLPGLVADGRDMGTVIFPDAGHKVFLTASADERAERRYKQLKDKGVSVTIDGLLREILARDARDASRAVAPLRPAEDAVRIDTTGLPIADVVTRVLDIVSRPGD